MLLIMAVYFLIITGCQSLWNTFTGLAKQRMGELSQLTATYISMVVQIKAQCSESIYFSKWKNALSSYLQVYQRISYKQQIIQVINFFIFSAGYFSLLVLGLYLVYQNRLSLGEMMACQILFLSFNEAVAQKTQFNHYIEQIESDLQSINDITAYPVLSDLTGFTHETVQLKNLLVIK